ETGEEALQLLLPAADVQKQFDVVVLDVMLPSKDGFTVVSELREAGQFVPTLLLTARGRPEDVVLGFAAGADDYLPKPFELSILIARIRGLLRRKQWIKNPLPKVEAPAAFSFGDKSINLDLLELRVADRVFPLTLMEATILRYLIEREGRTVSRKA